MHKFEKTFYAFLLTYSEMYGIIVVYCRFSQTDQKKGNDFYATL